MTAVSVALGISTIGLHPEDYPYLFHIAGASLALAFPFWLFRGLNGRESLLVLLLFASMLGIKALAFATEITKDADTAQSLLLVMRATGWLLCLWPPLILSSCVVGYTAHVLKRKQAAERNEDDPASGS